MKIFRNNIVFIFITLVTLSIFSGCFDKDKKEDKAPTAKIFVIADTHLMAPSLLVKDGTAFQTYLTGDRKLLEESKVILDETINLILSEKPDLVLIPGDLTKDGAKVSHEMMAAALQKVVDSGIKVLVVPGNHDINNPHAISYDGDTETHVDHITPDEFKQIYANFGYKNAKVVDENSLSYVAEPIKGLVIIAMDSCKYDTNVADGKPKTEGSFSIEKLNWIYDQAAKANSDGKLIFGMMHHALTEHYTSQSTLFSEYVIKDWDSLDNEFATRGMKAVFTGHYHANDVVKIGQGESSIFDIMTGSTVTYPNPYRVVSLTEGKTLTIATKYVRNVSHANISSTFEEYSENFLDTGLNIVVPMMLQAPPYSLDSTTAASLAPPIVAALKAHYVGDESGVPAELNPTMTGLQQQADALKASGDSGLIMQGMMLEQIIQVINSIFNDLPSKDNNLQIDLTTGEVTE